ncbi:MAG: hypothetical protein ACFB2Z_01270 [Maricaulaceae bacterium]
MMIRSVLRALGTAAAILLGAGLAHAQSFALVVSAENAYDADPDTAKAQVRRLYLKDQSAWPGGEDAAPFARSDDSPEQQAFLASVLGLNPTELAAHWARLKQINGETPPRAVASARLLVRQIARNPGAFAVLAADEATEAEGVRVLFTFE